MTKAGSILVLIAVGVVLVLAPVAWAADVQGKIKAVDPSGRVVVFEDGTQIMIPPTLAVERGDLKPGADVKASYEERNGQKVATSIHVMTEK